MGPLLVNSGMMSGQRPSAPIQPASMGPLLVNSGMLIPFDDYRTKESLQWGRCS